MATLAYAGATSHVSGIVRSPGADPEGAAILDPAWEKMSATIRQVNPDVVILIGTDHQETFGLDNYPVFAIGQADTYPAWNEHGIPGGPATGRSDISAELHRSLINQGFDVSLSMHLPLDHGYTVPQQRLGIEDIPIVPVFVNCNQPPLPTMRRCHQLGVALRKAITQLPEELTVAVLATGGISHWVALPRQGEINEDWDQWFLQTMVSGDLTELLDITDEEVLESAGNGALEVRTWVVASACAGERGGALLGYAPMYPWVTGIGVLDLEVARP